MIIGDIMDVISKHSIETGHHRPLVPIIWPLETAFGPRNTAQIMATDVRRVVFRKTEILSSIFISITRLIRRSTFIAFEIWTIFYCLFVLQVLLLIYFIYSFFEISINGQKKLDKKKRSTKHLHSKLNTEQQLFPYFVCIVVLY